MSLLKKLYATPFLFLLCLLSSNLSLQAQAGKANENGDPPRIVTSNWNHYMNDHGCVVLDEDGSLIVSVVINVGVPDVSTFPAIYYQFDFTGFSDFNGPVTSFEPVVYDNQTFYQARIPYKIPYSDACIADPNAVIPIDYTITLMTDDGSGAYINYPINNYLNSLFPLALVDDGNGSINTNPIFTGTKNLCCGYDSSNDPQFRTTANTAFSTSIAPNPFSETIRIKHYQAQAGILNIELFDSTGKVWKRQSFKNVQEGWSEVEINTDQLAPGFYYCRVNNDQIFKTVKLNN